MALSRVAVPQLGTDPDGSEAEIGPDDRPGTRRASCTHLPKSRLEPLGQVRGVAIGPEMHENQPGLFVQHMIVNRRDLDAVGPKCLDDRIDLGRAQNEVTIDGCVTAVELEIERCVHSHIARDRGTHCGYMDIVTRYVDVEYTSAHTARVANDPLYFPGEIGLCLRARSYRVQGGLRDRQRLSNSFRHLHLVAASDEMDVHNPRILVEQMIVESG